MSTILETKGAVVGGTPAEFQANDVIRDSAATPTAPVFLDLTASGTLDLTAALEGQRAATVHAFSAGNTIWGGALGDTLYGGGGDDVLHGARDAGETGDDRLDGGAGNDVIFDDGGLVSIDGGAGDDIIHLGFDVTGGTVDGGAGRDVLASGGLADLTGLTIRGVEVLETGGSTITGSAEQFQGFDRIVAVDDPAFESFDVSLILNGAGSLDLSKALEGRRGANVIASGEGNTIIGGSHGDVFNGGASADVLDGAGGGDLLYGHGGSDVLSGGDGDDVLFGDDYSNGLDLDADDILSGGDGDDAISDFVGRVSIDGGAGDDVIYLGFAAGTGTVEGGAGRDTLRLGGLTDLTGLTLSHMEVLETGGATITATAAQFQAFSSIVAQDSADGSKVTLRLEGAGSLDLGAALEGRRGAVVYASDEGNAITGGAKDDRLVGGDGGDTLKGGDGDDWLTSSQNLNDTADDVLDGGDGNDILIDRGGHVSIDGGAGDDAIYLGEDTTGTVDGGAGRDILSWNGQTDLTGLSIRNVEVLETAAHTFTGTAATLQAFETIAVFDGEAYAGHAVQLALSGAGRLDLTKALGGSRAATVMASDAGNTIIGGAKGDTLIGGAGDDVLTGAAGDDTLVGGGGHDTAVYAGAFASYRVLPSDAGHPLTVVGEGRDELTGIETLRFKDGTYDVASGTFTPAAAVPAPSLVLAKAALSAGGGAVLSLEGRAAPGTTLAIRMDLPTGGTATLASVETGADGRFALTLPAIGPIPGGAWHLPISAVAASASGAASEASGTLLVEVGTSAEIGAGLSALSGETGLAAILLTDRPNLVFATKAAMDTARAAYAEVLGKIVGPYTLTVFQEGSFGRSSEIYDAAGHLTATVRVDAEGLVTSERFALDGSLLGKTVKHDGLREEFSFGIKDKPYASQHAVFDAAGRLVEIERFTAGGDPMFREIHHANGGTTLDNYASDGSHTSQTFAADGKLVELSRIDADGTLILTDTRGADGTRAIHHFDAETGRETSFILRHADGSTTSGRFDIEGKPYADQVASFDAAGKLLSMQRHYGDAAHTLAFSEVRHADGSSEVHGYDTSGRETSRIVVDAAGERDVVHFTYSGASTAPATTVLTHYGADGTRELVDITGADGRHSQTAFAPGGELVSHAGVADLFKGFSGGSDIFVFGPNAGHDVVLNFEAGSAGHDVLRIDDGYAKSFSALAGHMTQVGADTLITLDAKDTILLKGVALASLTADHVQFVHDDFAGV